MTEADRDGRGFWSNHRFTVLLISILVHLMAAPTVAKLGTVERGSLGGTIVALSFTLMLLITVLAVRPRRSLLVAMVVLALPTVAVPWIELGLRHPLLSLVGQLLDAFFLVLVCALLLRHILRQKLITRDVIAAALCAYLLLGVAWAFLYGAVESASPGSFRVIDDGMGPFLAETVGDPVHADAAIRRIYFSFITLLTVGYGDIVPLNSTARLCAVMEAFCGQIFLVVLVARLVGVQVTQSMASADPDSEPGSDQGKRAG